MKIYMVISERSDGSKGVVGTFMDEYNRVETFVNASDAIDLLDEMKHKYESMDVWYYIHSTEV